MTSHHVRAARRNFYVVGATTVTVGALFLFPTSTNRTGSHTPVVAPIRTVIGKPVETRYGPVRVQVRLRGQRILAATAVTYPQASPELRAINRRAIPLLQKETLAAQSSRIDSVSGATYTSEAYVGSLQSALDAAHP